MRHDTGQLHANASIVAVGARMLLFCAVQGQGRRVLAMAVQKANGALPVWFRMCTQSRRAACISVEHQVYNLNQSLHGQSAYDFVGFSSSA
jgi:hypothetical protein